MKLQQKRALRALLLAAAIAVTGASAAGSNVPERLPRARPGVLVPTAAGVVLGQTKRAAIRAKWGPPSLCRNYGPGRLEDDWRCIWEIGSASEDGPTPPRAGALVDWVDVKFAPRADFASGLTFITTDWRRSALRGWRTPEGIRIGSRFATARRVYPQLRRSDEGARVWHVVPYYTFRGARYDLSFNLDRGFRDLVNARVAGISVDWYAPSLQCKLASEPVEATARRIHGTCFGGSYWYVAGGGKLAAPLLTFFGLHGARIKSVSSPFDPGCDSSGCRARAKDWSVDVTLAFESSKVGVEVAVQGPQFDHVVDERGPRYRFS